VRLDHYKIANAQGTIHVGSLIQSHKWTGPLCVLRYVAQHSQDIVTESEGRDEHGEHIVQFLVVSHWLVSHLEDIISGNGHSITYFRYPPSLGCDHFIPCACPIEYLTFPAPLLPSDYSDDTLQYWKYIFIYCYELFLKVFSLCIWWKSFHHVTLHLI
jgi:hypothetical protein